jgi:hypothetical protein
MANTTNYNWETPDDTDLVKDGAAAIRTLGSSVDTTTKALNPSTTLGDIEYRSATANTNTRLGIGSTGQILSVVAGVPAWVANDVGDITAVSAGTGISGGGTSGDITITNSMATTIDAKGDLIGGTGADTFARLAVGANDTVLTADSSAATGLKWAAPAGSSGPAFNAYRATTAQTITTSTHTKVQLNAEFFDTDNCFDSTTNYRFTPTKAGKYQVNVDLRIAATSGNVARHIIRIYKNGTPFTRILDNTFATDAVCHSGADLIDMNGTTDYLELYVYAVATTPTIEPLADDSKTCFSASWIRS